MAKVFKLDEILNARVLQDTGDGPLRFIGTVTERSRSGFIELFYKGEKQQDLDYRGEKQQQNLNYLYTSDIQPGDYYVEVAGQHVDLSEFVVDAVPSFFRMAFFPEASEKLSDYIPGRNSQEHFYVLEVSDDESKAPVRYSAAFGLVYGTVCSPYVALTGVRHLKPEDVKPGRYFVMLKKVGGGYNLVDLHSSIWKGSKGMGDEFESRYQERARKARRAMQEYRQKFAELEAEKARNRPVSTATNLQEQVQHIGKVSEGQSMKEKDPVQSGGVSDWFWDLMSAKNDRP